MSEPIAFLILVDLKAALQGIAAGAGYHYTVEDVAVKLDANQGVEDLDTATGPRPFILVDVQPDQWRHDSGDVAALVMPITIHWVHLSDVTDDDDRLRTYYRGCADVERAIGQDVSRGGYAKDTTIVKQTLYPVREGEQVWAATDIEILVYRPFGSPNAA